MIDDCPSHPTLFWSVWHFAYMRKSLPKAHRVAFRCKINPEVSRSWNMFLILIRWLVECLKNVLSSIKNFNQKRIIQMTFCKKYESTMYNFILYTHTHTLRYLENHFSNLFQHPVLVELIRWFSLFIWGTISYENIP